MTEEIFREHMTDLIFESYDMYQDEIIIDEDHFGTLPVEFVMRYIKSRTVDDYGFVTMVFTPEGIKLSDEIMREEILEWASR